MQSDKPSNESISFRVAVVLVSGVGIAVFGTNLGYYNRIREEDTDCNLISDSEAKTAWWINLIALIIFAIIFIWALTSGPMSINRRKRMEDQRARDFVEKGHVPFNPKIKNLPLVSHKFGDTVEPFEFISASEPFGFISASEHGRGSSVTLPSQTFLNIQTPNLGHRGGITYPDISIG